MASSFNLNVKSAAPTGGYWLELGFYDTFSQQRLPFIQNGVPSGSAVRLGPFRVAGAAPAAATAVPRATFGAGEIALLRASWQGSNLTVDWDALRAPQASYTVFVHAVDASGRLVGQWDGPPHGGSYPTSLWAAGDVVHDVYPIGVRPSPGLRLEIGMYTQPDIRRLPVTITGQAATADHFTLPASDTASAP